MSAHLTLLRRDESPLDWPEYRCLGCRALIGRLRPGSAMETKCWRCGLLQVAQVTDTAA